MLFQCASIVKKSQSEYKCIIISKKYIKHFFIESDILKYIRQNQLFP